MTEDGLSQLDTQKVFEALRAELQNFERFKALQIISSADVARLGAKTVGTRWLLTLKPDGTTNARLVAQELNLGSFEDAYAATPMSIASRLMLMLAFRRQWGVFTFDLKAAFLHAPWPAEEKAIVLVPPRFLPPGVDAPPAGHLWRAARAVYGLRRSPRIYQEWLASRLQQDGWTRCVADAQLYALWKPATALTSKSLVAVLSIHADDGLFVCSIPTAEFVFKGLEGHCQVKRGPQVLADWVLYLGRELRRTPQGWQVRARPTMVTQLLADFGLAQAKPVSTPGPTAAERVDASQPLSDTEVTQFRSGVGRLLWMAPVRPELTYLIKELCRHMQQPTREHMAHLRWLLRFLAAMLF